MFLLILSISIDIFILIYKLFYYTTSATALVAGFSLTGKPQL